jgi:hypothetical protein
LQELRTRSVQIAKAIGAIGAFAATMSGLVFGLWPTLKPAEPPATKGAILSNVTVDHVTFGQYLDRGGYSRSQYRPVELERRGALVGFDFNIKGYLHKDLPLWWQLIDARTGEQIDESQDLVITPTAAEDQNTLPVWVRVPRDANRRFFVEIQLLNDRAVPLAHIRTKRFSGT